MLLRYPPMHTCYNMSVTDVVYGATGVRAMSSTDRGYAATRTRRCGVLRLHRRYWNLEWYCGSAVLRWGTVGPAQY